MLAGCGQLVVHAACLLVHKRLVAAVEPCSEACVTSPLLREACVTMLMLHARRQLPIAVCPSEILLLRRMPLTPTGKLDRVALRPVLEAEVTAAAAAEGAAAACPSAAGSRGAQAPQGELEKAVAAAWVTALGVPAVSRRSDFLRLGGDSIKALQVTRGLAFELVRWAGADAGGMAAAADVTCDGPRFLGSALPPSRGEIVAEVAESCVRWPRSLDFWATAGLASHASC